MKRELQSIFSFFILSTLLIVLPGCISQKKLDQFRQQHAASTVMEYTYRNKPYLAAVKVDFQVVDQAPGAMISKLLSEETSSLDLNNFEEPAMEVVISPPVFMKKQHQGKIKLLLNEKNIIASEAFQIDLDANLIHVDEICQLFFRIDKKAASKRASFKLNLDLIDEEGQKLESDGLSYTRFLDLTLPKREKAVPGNCPEKRFTIHFSSKTEDEIFNVLMKNDTLGVFFVDPDGKIKVNICEELLPISYSFMIEAETYESKKISIQFKEAEPDIFVELEEKQNGQSNVEIDHDGDGLVGEEDRCPQSAGPASNGGCPVDTDGDGVLDVNDRCPDRPGPAQNNGCPPPPEINENKNTRDPVEVPDELVEDTFWENIEKSEVPSDFENYLDQFPEGKYVQQAQKRLQDSYTKIARGLMSILIPDTMELNVPEIVTVMISGDTSLAARERVIDEFLDQQELAPVDIPKVRDELIKITEIMRAELRDPSPPNNPNFFIDPPGRREQKVDLYGEDPTIWNWTVTPLKKGEHQLNVIVYIIFDQNGKEVPKEEEQIFKIDIIVKETFLEKNWPWLVLGGLLLLGVLLWFFLFRKKEKQKERLQLQLPYQEIMGLIGEGEMKDALEKLEKSLDGVSDKYQQQVILFKSRLAENEENINMGVVDTKDATLEQTRITKGVLALMGKLKEEFEITS